MKNKIYTLLLGSAFMMMSCDSLLERPELIKIPDTESNYWRNENDLRLFANDFYPNYFVGYNTFSDDFTSQGAQANLLGTIPTGTGGSTTATPTILRLEHPGPNWNFYWVRKANLLLSRLENVAKPNISEEAFNHWTSVGRFFRGYEYARLVSNFGDIPYYDQEVPVNDPDVMYKTRDPRGEVMDKVYDDFTFVLNNMRENDGTGYVNRYAAAALISNLMLFEGSWQKYHNLDGTRAKKYLELARDAAQYVMDSGKWSFGADFKSLFASENLSGNSEVIFHRIYDDALAVRHAVGSYSNRLT